MAAWFVSVLLWWRLSSFALAPLAASYISQPCCSHLFVPSQCVLCSPWPSCTIHVCTSNLYSTLDRDWKETSKTTSRHPGLENHPGLGEAGLAIKRSSCQLWRPASSTQHTQADIPLDFSPGRIALGTLNHRRLHGNPGRTGRNHHHTRSEQTKPHPLRSPLQSLRTQAPTSLPVRLERTPRKPCNVFANVLAQSKTRCNSSLQIAHATTDP